MDDLISRQKAKDAIDMALDHIDHVPSWVYDKLLNALNEVPPVQSELSNNSPELDNKNGELISRQAAIDALHMHLMYRMGTDSNKKRLDEWINGLPSAQPEPIRINLNEPIKVKLTDWGKEIYYHQYDRTNRIAGREICKPKFPKEDENGYTEFQLWCFMELYGEHMRMTLPNVIEPLEIVYER